ncbi:protein kinase [Roseococcus sp. SYP-B2431]|uniref:leucine-rich repeat-containing protein kinase family protein n=1 Tax=Roseococcus sp. SYP-B2431 TaxID=2496640 RepID=UPI00103C7BC1|nr:leucine-rich repeat-containing protein kinase family protein [Roseococcus sp. SYP-B2431]TCI00823.1 protein kinase [Roseococcus sp. SYP-B2431]
MSHATLEALRRGTLAGARELHLTGCGLTEFPPEIYGLAETLEVLDIGHNTLVDLPADLYRLGQLRVLFASGNRFARLPPALGDCPALSQIGFRASGLSEVPAEALPPRLRWLTLTDNAITALPAALGERPALAKLMLAGNRLQHLPETLLGAPGLELLRIAANHFEALPHWLEAHPTLAWLAWAGNPFDKAPSPKAAAIHWRELELGALLGQGASGLVHHALRQSGETREAVALKLFKGAMTSDGLPRHEMAACLLAGGHPQLVGAIGRLKGHPEGQEGLIMPLIPGDWRALAGPPSLESCTRDVYDPGLRLSPLAALRLARRVAAAAAHLHGRGLLHGDLYAHNILWDGAAGEAVLSDFGAACFPPPGRADGLQRVEARAFGILLGELLARIESDAPAILSEVRAWCLEPRPEDRPSMAEVARALSPA